MTAADLLTYLRLYSFGVQASVSPSGHAQAAVVGIVVTEAFEALFDALDSSRKVENLRRNPHVALAIGGMTQGDERTVQHEGVADEPKGPELQRLSELYLDSFPEGRDRRDWPGLTDVRVRPTRSRYSDSRQDPAGSGEFDRGDLGL